MTVQRRKQKFLGFWLAASLVATLTSVASTTEPATATHSFYTGYHWARATNPIVIKAGNDVTLESQSFLQKAATDWSQSAVLDVVVSAGSGVAGCPFVTGQITVCNGEYGENGWAGQANFVADRSGHITAATARVNDTYVGNFVPTYRQFLFCHEIGHTLGLGHDTANADSCMHPGGDMTVSPTPGAHDLEQLETIYGHLDTAKTKGGGRRPGGRHSEHGETIEVVELPDGGTRVSISIAP